MKGISKKTIALISIMIILFAGAVAGVALYLRDDGTTIATDEQNKDSQIISEQSSTQNSDKTPNEKEENIGDNEVTNQDKQGNQEIKEDENEEEDEQQEATGAVNVENKPQQEFVLYRDKLVAEDFLVGWTPISISAIMANTDRAINKPILELSKASYTEADLMKTGEFAIPEETQYNAVRQGERIIYEITVKNVSSIDAKSIKVIDRVPQKTKLEDIEGNGTEKDGVITWIIDIPALQEVKIRFAVTVDEEALGNAENIAIVNGDETNEVKNPIITAEKSSQIYRSGKLVEAAKVRDNIKYTITIKNTGDIDGTTKIIDKVPEGTTLVQGSAVGAIVSQEGNILWDNILVPAGNEIMVEFEVTINPEVTTSVKNVAIVSETETNETEDKVANIEGHKIVDKTVAWVGEELTYKITLINKGIISGKTTVTDVIPDGTTYILNSVTGNGVYDSNSKKLIWTDVEVVPGTPVELTFKVRINTDKKTSVFNTAILDENDIPQRTETTETKVINIIGEKTSSHDANLTELGQINYTIKLTNIGNAVGTITVTDAIPAGTTYVANSVDSKGRYDNAKNTITWANVSVAPGNPVDLTFSVTVNLFINGETNKTIINQASIGNKVEDEATKKLIDIPVTKVWVNDANVKGIRTDIDVELLRDGKETGIKTKILKTEQDTWKGNFIGVPEYDSTTGKKINYSVKELTKIEGYKNSVNGTTITNSYTEPTKTIKVTKVWDDNGNTTKDRPNSIELQLKGNGKTYKQEVSADNNWQYTFTVPKYNSDRQEIQYTADEAEIKSGDLKYYKKSSVTGSMTAGFTITNKINYKKYTANVEEYSTTTKNKNVYIVIDASSSMNYTLDNGKTKMETACNNVANLIRNVFKISSNSTVEVITFNTAKTDNRKLIGTKVFESRATNQNQANALADSVDAITQAPWSSEYGKYKTWGTNMYAALELVNSEIENYKNGNENIVIFVGDGAPTDNSRYPNGNISNPFNPNCDCPVYNMARTIKGKVSAFFSLGVALSTTTEDYTPEEARAIIQNIGKEYYDIEDTLGFTTAFNNLFIKMNTKYFSSSNETYNPFITIQANGAVLLDKGVTLASDQVNKIFTNQSQIDNTTGITYDASTNKFTIDTRKITGSISLKYTIQ